MPFDRELFKDPPDHERPQRFRSLTAPGACDPFTRKFNFLGPTIIFTLIDIGCYLLLPGGKPLDFILFLLVGPAVGYMMMIAFDGENKRSSPVAFQLAQSETGRALLQEGEALHERRERLVEGSKATFPLLMVFLVPQEPGGDIHEYDQIARRIWDHHLALERNLADRQRRHLAGETVRYSQELAASP